MEYLKAILLLESAIPKKNLIGISKVKSIKKTIRESRIFRENTVNRGRLQIEAALFEKEKKDKKKPRLLFEKINRPLV